MDTLQALEQKIDMLIDNNSQLKQENGNQSVTIRYLQACCEDLLKKNKHASERIHALIHKLKTEFAQ
jgi:uncharacterized protein (TIGR02449 family)